MGKRKPIMKIYSKKKYIELNRPTISLLGDPPYMTFVVDGTNGRLIVLPSFEQTLDAYEIPKYYWDDKRQTCRICRLLFFLALKRKFNWEEGRSYVVGGIFQILEEGRKLVVFNFAEAVEFDRHRQAALD